MVREMGDERCIVHSSRINTARLEAFRPLADLEVGKCRPELAVAEPQCV